MKEVKKAERQALIQEIEMSYGRICAVLAKTIRLVLSDARL